MLGDCHMHMVLDGVEWRSAMGRHREQVQDNWIRSVLQAYADAGVRYLRDGGDKYGAAARAAQLASEYGIEYRTPLFPIARKGRYGGFIGRTFEDFAGYRALVDEVIDGGGDFVKIMISGLMDFDHYGVITSQPLTRQEIADMIAYAHDRGMAVMAHANGTQTILDALDAGVDSVEHGAYMNEECVAQLAQSNAIWTPTAVTIGNLIGCGRYPDAVLKPLLELHLSNVRDCVSMGGTVALGSDAGAYRVPHPRGVFDEAELLKSAGVTEGELCTAEACVRSRFRKA